MIMMGIEVFFTRDMPAGGSEIKNIPRDRTNPQPSSALYLMKGKTRYVFKGAIEEVK